MHFSPLLQPSRFRLVSFAAFFIFLSAFALISQRKPVLYIIGDSTVRNGDGTGKNNQMGWGSVFHPFFDTSKISIRNYALGGRSSRTFITEGHWEKLLQQIMPGDYIIMQFGHNDSGPLDDTARARGTIRGIGDESREVYNPIMKKQETVHTYGWYLRKYVREGKANGAIAIICSPVPRNDWDGNKVKRSSESYAKWSREIAEQEAAYFIDLNNLVAERYESMGVEQVNPFFPADHTHTNEDGAVLNASILAETIRSMKALKLHSYLGGK
jgi:rhamnogalacturonan acetylesterase